MKQNKSEPKCFILLKNMIIITIIRITDVCLFRVKMAVANNPKIVPCVVIVARLRISVKPSTNGIVPIVQSQQRSLGRKSNLRLTAAR